MFLLEDLLASVLDYFCLQPDMQDDGPASMALFLQIQAF